MLDAKQIEKVIKHYIAALNRRDFAAIAAFYAADATVEDPVGSEPYRGRDAIRGFYEKSMGSRNFFFRLDGPIRIAESAAAFSFIAQETQKGETQLIAVTDTFRLDSGGLIKEMQAYFGETNFHRVGAIGTDSSTPGKISMHLPMAGRVALVTGGGSGMGQAIAVEFARRGASVVLAGRRKSACLETLEMIEGIGGQGLVQPTDVSIESQVQALVAATMDQYGRLDYVSNTAGSTHDPCFLVETSLEDYESTQAANARAIFLCMKHQVRAMLKLGQGGSIVNVTSDAAIGGLPLFASYTASKHAAIGLTRAAALEHARDGIRINSLAPGPIITPMLLERPGELEKLQGTVPAGRIGTVQDVADAVVWLCSEQASFVYGQVIQVDGALGGVSCVAPGLPLPEKSWR